MSPNVLPSTFKLFEGVTSVSAARCLLMYCQVPSICLGESLLWLCFSKALVLSVKLFVGSCCFRTGLCGPAPVQESSSRRAALSAAKCFQCTAKYLQSVWGSHFCVCCQVSPNALPSAFSLSGGVTESVARCLLMYCQVPSICLGESLLCLCFSRALISSAKSFVGSCCSLDWALCCSYFCVGELQSPGCCQVPPSVLSSISFKELLLMSNLSALLLIFLHTQFIFKTV